MRNALYATALGGALAMGLGAGTAHALPVYLGISIDGGSINTLTSNDGGATYSGSNAAGSISITATGTPGSNGTPPQPYLFSDQITFDSSGAHTVHIYVSELGLTQNNFSALSTGFANNSNSSINLTESSYAQNCAASSCVASDAFATTNLLATDTVAPGAPTTSISSPLPAGLGVGSQWSETEVFTLNFASAGQSSAGSIGITSVPEPASIALLGIGALGVTMLRRRKSGATAV